MGVVRRGVHRPLEDVANELIRKSLEGVTKHSEKKDILTPWKEMARYKREVYVESGVADASIRQGIFKRAYNPDKPDLNSRLGASPPRSRKRSTYE